MPETRKSICQRMFQRFINEWLCNSTPDRCVLSCHQRCFQHFNLTFHFKKLTLFSHKLCFPLLFFLPFLLQICYQDFLFNFFNLAIFSTPSSLLCQKLFILSLPFLVVLLLICVIVSLLFPWPNCVHFLVGAEEEATTKKHRWSTVCFIPCCLCETFLLYLDINGFS